jgi:ADP-heptose:LPS heptosyltransferase
VPKAQYVKVKDFKELACVIASSKLFIGNQSFCFSLAEAMKSPRILEVSPKYPNVITAGPHGYDFMDNQCFEQLVKMRLED